MILSLRKTLTPIALAALLGGCAAPADRLNAFSSSGGPGQPAASSGPVSDCDAQPIQNMLGQAYSESVAETARQRSGSRAMRLLRPGEVMTMEYNPTRLNIILDGKGAIEALRCG